MENEPTFANWQEELSYIDRRSSEDRQWIREERLKRSGYNLRQHAVDMICYMHRIDGILDRLYNTRS
jgi:hypothetical protein